MNVLRSLADASERGCGQCPTLFKLCLADLDDALAGLLDTATRSSLRAATAPLLRSFRRELELATRALKLL